MRPLNLFYSVVLSIFIFKAVFSQPQVIQHSIKFSDVSCATLVGEDGVIMQTTDNGVTWNEQSSWSVPKDSGF
jgi:photosystem II stability/assembly factor-like uncharacterized protein